MFLSVQLSKAEIINKIEITGNNKVSDETIKIYGEIEINKDYNEADLNKILNNLYSTNFFEDISINLSNNTLKISLKEYPIVNQLILNGEPSKRISDEIKRLISLNGDAGTLIIFHTDCIHMQGIVNKNESRIFRAGFRLSKENKLKTFARAIKSKILK